MNYSGWEDSTGPLPARYRFWSSSCHSAQNSPRGAKTTTKITFWNGSRWAFEILSRVHTACLQHGLLKLWIQSFIVLPHSALPLVSKFKSEFSSLFLTCLRRSRFPEGGQNTEALIRFRALVLHCLLSRGLQEQYWLASGAAGAVGVGAGEGE